MSSHNANDAQVGGGHYKGEAIQPWDVIHAWGLNWFAGNVVKYVSRYKNKNGLEDLRKARHYLDKLIEIEEQEWERLNTLSAKQQLETSTRIEPHTSDFYKMQGTQQTQRSWIENLGKLT